MVQLRICYAYIESYELFECFPPCKRFRSQSYPTFFVLPNPDTYVHFLSVTLALNPEVQKLTGGSHEHGDLQNTCAWKILKTVRWKSALVQIVENKRVNRPGGQTPWQTNVKHCTLRWRGTITYTGTFKCVYYIEVYDQTGNCKTKCWMSSDKDYYLQSIGC